MPAGPASLDDGGCTVFSRSTASGWNTSQKLLDERLIGMTMLGRHLLESGQLRDGIELDEVRDVLWTYIAVELYELLVMGRGWTLDRYAAWIARAITGAICP